jgi:hypothetical protein
MARLIVALGLLWLSWPGLAAPAASGKIAKVLPHYLDLEGQHLISPSLYDRDAYQARLRKSPALRSGLRFDVRWKAPTAARVTLRVDLRGTLGNEATQATLETTVEQPGRSSRWAAVALKGDAYKRFGELLAWRVSLLEGGRVLAEQHSFLW